MILVKNLKRLAPEYIVGIFVPVILTVVSSFVFDGSMVDFNMFLSSVSVVITLLIMLITCIVLYINNRFTTKNIIITIMLVSFFIRLIYVLKTPYTVNQHDIEKLGDAGHLEYIYRFAKLKGLPASNEWQFSNPPFYYLTAATVYKINEILGFSVDRCFENVQLLSLLFSSITVTLAYKILRLLGFKGLPLILSFSVISFHPTMTIFAGSINNDTLALMTSACAVYFILKQKTNQNIKYVLFSGMFCGISMMTKYLHLIVAVAILVYIFIEALKTQKYFLKTVFAFSFPCAIIGLWYQIRGIVLFDQNFFHYNELSTTSLLYIPDSFIKRLIILPKIEQSVFCSVYSDTNVIAYLVKSSVFGEFSFSSYTVSGTLLALNIILIITSVIAAVYLIKNKKINSNGLLLFLIILIGEILFYLIFNFIQPFGCNMDFRLIAITLLCGTVFLAMLLKSLHIKSRKSKSAFAVYIFLTVIIIAFCLFSSLLII